MADLLDKALMTHAVIKQRLKSQVLDSAEVDAETVRSDRLCEFGTWIYGPAGQVHRHLPEFQELLAVHAAFHQAAYDALLLVRQDRRAEAVRILESGPFELRSQDMKNALIRLKNALKRPT